MAQRRTTSSIACTNAFGAQPDLERAMARKISAKVTTLPTSHVP